MYVLKGNSKSSKYYRSCAIALYLGQYLDNSLTLNPLQAVFTA